MNKHNDFETRVKSLLDESADDISPEVSRRLQHARNKALAENRHRRHPYMLPLAAAASVLVAIISVNVWHADTDNELAGFTLAMETEIELLTSKDNLELLEDLEFIQWLAETEGYAG